MARRFALFWGGAVCFWITEPEGHEGCHSHSEWNPVLPCHPWRGEEERRKKELVNRYQRITVKSQNLWHQHPFEWNCSFSSVSSCWWPFSSAASHLLSVLQSVTLLACSLSTRRAVCWLLCLRLYFSRYCTVRLKIFPYLGGLYSIYYLCLNYY